jgi:uncharacterized damage-inducible protein DinB
MVNHGHTTKQGRPREYDIRPLPDFADEGVALAAAALDELRARAMDQIADLPREALVFVPPGTTLSIGALAAHLIWAEAGWVERIAAVAAPALRAPASLRAAVDPAGRALPRGERLDPDLDAAALVALCHEIRDSLTVPVLSRLADAEALIPGGGRPTTPRAVLMHLIWHWTYHSAHIGLIREQWGSGYEWTFGAMA